MWKYLNESVEGTSHRQSGTSCQDSSFVSPYRFQDEQVLVLACADGAGSASESHDGSKLACEVAVKEAVAFLEAGRPLVELTDEALRSWAGTVHSAINAEATTRQVSPREMACTLLLAVIGPSVAAFAQIGDGAIVVFDEGSYRPMFWPQSGEYQNTTFFISDPQFDQPLQTKVIHKRIDELALFTDGLQMLALNFAKQGAHEPFFAPMFNALREAADAQDLIVPMRQFLDSPGVNDRTDDDKTLILASRVQRADATI